MRTAPDCPCPARVALAMVCLLLAQPTAHAASQSSGTAHVHTSGDVSCSRGCRKAFKPVCGNDGRTYSNLCLARCQGIALQHEGPCQGEDLLQASNMEHIAEDAGSSVGNDQLHAFASEGFVYRGQMRFTKRGFLKPTGVRAGRGNGMHGAGSAQHEEDGRTNTGEKQHDSHFYARSHTQANRGGGAASTGGEQQQQQQAGDAQQGAARALRITSDGHLYSADLADLEVTTRQALAAIRARGGLAAEGSTASGHMAHGSLGSHYPSQQIHRGLVVGSLGAVQHEVMVPGELSDEARNAGSTDGSSMGEAASEAYPDPFATSANAQAGGRKLHGIFAADDRIDCPRTVTYPFTAIGQINIKDKAGSYVCSGALVGPDVVLTAAHCVFSRSFQGFYDTLSYAPSRYLKEDGGIVNPYGTIPWLYVTIYQGYSAVITPDPNVWDIAVIKLSAPIGLSTGWLGILEPCGESAPARYVANTVGYPSDMPTGSCKFTQCAVTQTPCTDSYLYHKCDTASGQSGSPLWMLALTTARKMGPYIRAVHNIEWVQSAPSGGTESYINSAVSITPEHYRTVLGWIAPAFANSTEATARSAPMAPARPPQ